MPIDRTLFFDNVRASPFGGVMSASAVRGCNAILDEWERSKLTDLRFLAYMLGTVLGECGRNMLPVREGFKKTDEDAREYVKSKGYKYAKVVNGNVYYGRGLVQLTWEANYKKMGALLGFNLVGDPDRALTPATAAKIMFTGMANGTFTTHKLSDYFNETTDWVNARKIINALDRAGEIAGYAKAFYHALQVTDKVAAPPQIPVTPAPPKSVDPLGPAAGSGASAGIAGWLAGLSLWQIALLVLAAAAVGYGVVWFFKKRG